MTLVSTRFQFYHACDEQKYVFCLMRLSVMQFCDFYAGIFAFWVTLVCMADLAPTWSSLLNVGGAMLVALGVEYDRTGLWVFVVPVATAFVCMVSSWVRGECAESLERGCCPLG